MPALLLLLALLLAPGPSPEEERLPVTEQGLADRAEDLLGSGAEGRRRLAAEATTGPAGARRAALRALAKVPAADRPAGSVEAGLSALGAKDPLLRRAGLDLLLVSAPAAAPLLEKLEKGPVEGLPAVPPERARDARFDLRRAAVERDFLATWTTDDGSFAGMYAGLKVHGSFGAKVLAAIAIDRRVAAGEVLGLGPYAWITGEAESRDRSECRYRALEALADAGDLPAREMLRPFLRRRLGPDGEFIDNPAPELYDELDRDPIPAQLDDSLREAIAALGDPNPLLRMIQASEESGHTTRDDILEMRRRASAYAVLAQASPTPEVRLGRLAVAERLQRHSMREKRRWGMSVDGVEYYNLACLYGRRDGPGDRERALKELETAVTNYAVTAYWLSRDGDLASLREEPRFKALVERLRAKEKALQEGGEPLTPR